MNSRIVVIGIGNLLLMDEGIGVHTINELEKHDLPGSIEIYDGGTGGFKLIDLMHGAARVIFIDAVEYLALKRFAQSTTIRSTHYTTPISWR